MRFLYLFSVWLHVVAAIIWIGGALFLALVLVPATRQAAYRGIAPALIQWSGARFRSISWVCLATLLLSGICNLAYRGFGWADLWSGQLWQGPFGRTLGIKLLLVALILLLSAVHDFVIGPQARERWQADATAAETLRLRRRASWFGRINLLLALIVTALGVTLVRGGI
ncbi:MAG: CopD family protein [Caldilineales bacterium]|nr:CopD family protein [Caldilineales bacterium]